MHKFVRNLITEWRRLGLPFSGEPILVAVSGGADSTALLRALADLKKRKKFEQQTIAAHFNHKLRGEQSDADEKFVRDLASFLGFECIVGTGKLSGKSNLEQRARDARYEFLSEIAAKHNSRIVLTAHTMNDQAETFLMNLVRGSGVYGLCAIPAIRVFGSVFEDLIVLPESAQKKQSEISDLKSPAALARPLLRWAKRIDTEDFCRENGIEFRHDSMNDNLAFTRVRIRKTVLPMLAEINPKIVETLARTAELLQTKSAIGMNSATKQFSLHNENSGQLTIKDLKLLDTTDLYAALRSWLRINRGNLRGLGLKHIAAVEQLIHSRKSGRIVELPGGSVVKQGGMLEWRKIEVEK